ncbi:uncharacterized protein LOC127863920 [Dreissena polymorpha]|uniref:uncharacterized protein LOC127863920 n=1 Tax=Dreissena polymorpha TaxID=45954 RepID=UPI0022656CEB|nr:uncharacterized protein LOC127863920 [Dreissena polymorpha]
MGDVQRGKQNGNLDVSAARTQIASLLTNLQRLENDHTVPDDLLKSTIQSVVLVRDSLPDLTQHAQHSSHSVDRYGVPYISFRIRSVNTTSGGGVLHQLMVDSFVQHSENGFAEDNPLKWNLNKRFYFTISSAGLVHFVHFHPQEIQELITLKKVLASTLTTRVQFQDGQSWTYDSMEEDHAGHLEHSYEAIRTSEGLKLVRSHRSLTDVHRMHYKV